VSEEVGIERITARGLAEVHDDPLELLREGVNGGATVGFLPPLSAREAAAYWHEVREALEGGNRRLLVARLEGRVVGTAQLDLAPQANGRHRAEVAKVLVRQDARRRGLGRRLMGAVETVAREEGRTLLVLDTRRGEPSEALYAALGYRRAGVIPNYARSADGTLHATVLLYEDLSGAL
jgi:acetyltransferase